MEFSCCAFFQECDYGRKECYFNEADPKKKERCRCYKLKRSQRNNTPLILNAEKFISNESKEVHTNQLSLF